MKRSTASSVKGARGRDEECRAQHRLVHAQGVAQRMKDVAVGQARGVGLEGVQLPADFPGEEGRVARIHDREVPGQRPGEQDGQDRVEPQGPERRDHGAYANTPCWPGPPPGCELVRAASRSGKPPVLPIELAQGPSSRRAEGLRPLSGHGADCAGESLPGGESRVVHDDAELLRRAWLLLRAYRAAARGYGTSLLFLLRRGLGLVRRRGFRLREALREGLLDPSLPEGVLAACIGKTALISLQKSVNPPQRECLTEDKSLFYPYCSGLGLPVPALYAVLGRQGRIHPVRPRARRPRGVGGVPVGRRSPSIWS